MISTGSTMTLRQDQQHQQMSTCYSKSNRDSSSSSSSNKLAQKTSRRSCSSSSSSRNRDQEHDSEQQIHHRHHHHHQQQQHHHNHFNKYKNNIRNEKDRAVVTRARTATTATRGIQRHYSNTSEITFETIETYEADEEVAVGRRHHQDEKINLLQDTPTTVTATLSTTSRPKSTAILSSLSSSVSTTSPEERCDNLNDDDEPNLVEAVVNDDEKDSLVVHNHHHPSRNSRPTTTNRCSSNRLTETRIRVFLQEYFDDYGSIGIRSYDTWLLFFEQYFSQDYVHIRPSGNPLYRDDFAKLLATDTKVISIKLISIDSIYIMKDGLSAVVVYTTDQIFSYKQTMNEDRAIVTCVLALNTITNEIKIVHDQRSVGIPIPDTTIVTTRWK